ncbi:MULTISPECIES: FtsB family cell division protein [Thermomonosporaceae]|uniref:FtsB family cell division protein n=1 Tax=Thermomonosporaceae TaxID=2012 RepID=UPI00255AB6B1|nr:MULTISPECIES: septum formation initiator family protein [Thermomonosporaceae]MDL4772306.1 septum formation initiator family protein [Actinomadura xylanilytica]
MAKGDDRAGPRGERHGDSPGDGARRANPALTSRAAILAVVMCAIALSLAYPVREYIAQRQEISDLQHKEAVARKQVEELSLRKQRLGDKSYIEREATRRLHYCRPGVKCYIVLDGSGGNGQQAKKGGKTSKPPWYETLWRSVEAADRPR